MKILLTLTFLTVCFTVNAQQALLKFKNGSTQDVYVLNIDSLYITTSGGQFSLQDIEEASFPERRGRDEHLYFELSNAGVIVQFDKTLILEAIQPPLGDSPQDQIIQLKRSLAEYQKTQQLGVGLQLAGVMLGVIGMITEEKAIMYTGMVTAGTGLVFHLSASRKLKVGN